MADVITAGWATAMGPRDGNAPCPTCGRPLDVCSIACANGDRCQQGLGNSVSYGAPRAREIEIRVGDLATEWNYAVDGQIRRREKARAHFVQTDYPGESRQARRSRERQAAKKKKGK